MAFTENLKQKVNDYLDRRYIHRLEDKVSLIAKEREQLQSWSDKDLRLASKAFKDDLKKGKGAGPFARAGFCSGLRSSQTCT